LHLPLEKGVKIVWISCEFEVSSAQAGSHNDPIGFEKEQVGSTNSSKGDSVIRSSIHAAFLSLMILMGGCASTPWSDDPQQPPPPSETPDGNVNVPPEDREKVEELIRARAEERERVAEANRRREAALQDLERSKAAQIEWKKRTEDPESPEMISAWQVRINELEEEVRKQNAALGRDREDGLQSPTPPRPPAPATPSTPQ
jgi:hypothetical protein